MSTVSTTHPWKRIYTKPFSLAALLILIFLVQACSHRDNEVIETSDLGGGVLLSSHSYDRIDFPGAPGRIPSYTELTISGISKRTEKIAEIVNSKILLGDLPGPPRLFRNADRIFVSFGDKLYRRPEKSQEKWEEVSWHGSSRTFLRYFMDPRDSKTLELLPESSGGYSIPEVKYFIDNIDFQRRVLLKRKAQGCEKCPELLAYRSEDGKYGGSDRFTNLVFDIEETLSVNAISPGIFGNSGVQLEMVAMIYRDGDIPYSNHEDIQDFDRMYHRKEVIDKVWLKNDINTSGWKVVEFKSKKIPDIVFDRLEIRLGYIDPIPDCYHIFSRIAPSPNVFGYGSKAYFLGLGEWKAYKHNWMAKGGRQGDSIYNAAVFFRVVDKTVSGL